MEKHKHCVSRIALVFWCKSKVCALCSNRATRRHHRESVTARSLGLLSVVLALLLVALVLTGCDSATDGGASGPPLEEVEGVSVYDTPSGWNFSVAENGDVWTNNNRGVASYSYGTDRWTQYNADDVAAIKAQNEGSVHVDGTDVWISYGWAGDETDGIGVTRWNPITDDFDHYLYPDTDGFPQGPVWYVSEDKEGDVWVGTRFGAGAARFDGTSWTPVYIEELGDERDDRYFDCNAVKHDNAGNVYFSTWRGGLHILSSEERWLHTEKGAANGTESFLLRGVYPTDIGFTDDGATVYAATRNWSHDGNVNDSVEPADGVWKYENREWTRLTTGVSEAYSAVLDERGYLWSTFATDYRLRYYDGSSWNIVDLGGYEPSASDYLIPTLVDGNYLWLSRYIAGADSQIVRIEYQ